MSLANNSFDYLKKSFVAFMSLDNNSSPFLIKIFKDDIKKVNELLSKDIKATNDLFVSEGAGREKVALFDALHSSQSNLS
jgi:hypothetical protein